MGFLGVKNIKKWIFGSEDGVKNRKKKEVENEKMG